MTEPNLVICGLAGVILFAILLFPWSTERYKKKNRPKTLYWTECMDAGTPPGAIALSPQPLTQGKYCQERCVRLPLVQKSVTPGHKRPACPKGQRAAYNQNMAEWACIADSNGGL